MDLIPKWVPMKWPCGPLQIARANKSQNGYAGLKSTLEAWAQPSALQLVKGTPINCLIVDWASGDPQDSAQQAALRPLLKAGSELGISFVGRISATENVGAVVAAGRSAGLSAVLLEASQYPDLDLPAILQFPREKVEWGATTAVFSSTGNVWPGVNLKTMSGNTAIAGPTGVPWVNSNGWFSLLARQMAPRKTLWLDFDPPESPSVCKLPDYCLAIADSRIYASRWIISVDDQMRAALLTKDTQATDVWNRMCETLSFFESHADWETYEPMGILAVISDFRRENAFMSGEVLNLLNRRQVQFLIMDRPRALAGLLAGLKAILWMDKEVPSADQHDTLLAFVRQGGLVIAATYWGPPGVKPHKKDWLLDYEIYNVLKGRIVVPERGFRDPYQVAKDAHLLVSRRNDLLRLYNPATTNCYASLDRDQQRQLVQVLNYSTQPASFVTLWVNARARSARLWRPAVQTSFPIQGKPASEGTSFDLPTISVNCAMEFERSP
jgi:hypothetical protein